LGIRSHDVYDIDDKEHDGMEDDAYDKKEDDIVLLGAQRLVATAEEMAKKYGGVAHSPSRC
jgi:hypothetical protein